MSARCDVAIAGGGPAGLALAIAAARTGLSVVVCERQAGLPDKACGEGLLPPGVIALAQLGARQRLSARDCAPIDGVRYVGEDGTSVRARLPSPGALGVRRTALVRALQETARAAGAELRAPCLVRGHRLTTRGVELDTDSGALEAALLVAADGLASPLRKAAGLEAPLRGARRFGVRQHFHVRPWSRDVEVHFAAGAEGYVTPVGEEQVGVAFLWEPRPGLKGDFHALLARFPRIAARIADAPAASRPRGAGPLCRLARARVAERLLLFGDAAGYVDAISGEGLSLAFVEAVELAPLLADMLAHGATRSALNPYERLCARHFRRYAFVSRTLLALAHRPAWRRRVLAWLAGRPEVFERVVAWALAGGAGDQHPPRSFASAAALR